MSLLPLRKPLCPTCKVATKAAGKGYCAPCLKAYQKAYNALWKDRHRRKLKPRPVPEAELMSDWDLEPYGRIHLRLQDNQTPSTDHLEAYCGWGVDRSSTHAYRRSGFDCSNDWAQPYLMGHYAVQRFWRRMSEGSAWEMGPDSEVFVDGPWSAFKGYRFGTYKNTPRKQVR
jgi:hypothetical protein